MASSVNARPASTIGHGVFSEHQAGSKIHLRWAAGPISSGRPSRPWSTIGTRLVEEFDEP